MAYICSVTWIARPGREEIVHDALVSLARETRNELGNIYFQPYCSSADTRLYGIFEVYRGIEDFEKHKAQAYYKQFVRDTVEPVLESGGNRAAFYETGSFETLGAASSSHLTTAYERVCSSYHAVDDIRMKLLALLPTVTGAGILFLSNLSDSSSPEGSSALFGRESLGAVAIFGLVITLGLFAYELFGIKKCHHLIAAGEDLESRLGVGGQFRSRPPGLSFKIFSVNEPFASAIIYSASAAVWVFLAASAWIGGGVAVAAALVVFVLGALVTYLGARSIGRTEVKVRSARFLPAEGGTGLP